MGLPIRVEPSDERTDRSSAIYDRPAEYPAAVAINDFAGQGGQTRVEWAPIVALLAVGFTVLAAAVARAI